MEVRTEGPDEGTGSSDFDSFFRQHYPGVARAAALVARDQGTGQDMAQEAFVRLHHRWGELASLDHARNFVYRVAINLARSHLRKHLRVSLFGLQRREEANPSADPSARATQWLAVADAMAGLSSRQRACVVLVDYVDLAPAAAGRILGIAPDTVRVHLMRGRRSLRERLATFRSER
ncbi:MAG: sigma-70 family RNA polymerase sigma factor [Actinomycetota bacterium]